jgi:hypothetical protein
MVRRWPKRRQGGEFFRAAQLSRQSESRDCDTQRLARAGKEREKVHESFLLVIIVLLVGIAGLGFYRGWFQFSTNNAEHQPSATITVDKDKIREDEQRGKEKLRGVGQQAREQDDVRAGTAKRPERQP